MIQRPIEKVKEEYADQWIDIYGVEGIAIGLLEGKPCITVFSSIEADKLRARIPSMVEGYAVIIKETGRFHALGDQ